MRLLIVDGSKDRRRALTEALAEVTNIVVQGAVPDVRSALRALTDVTPDVVITDVTLPDGDGTYLIERMRRLSRSPSVVVHARRASEEQRQHYLASGADRYVDGADPANVRDAVLQLVNAGHDASVVSHDDTLRLLGRMTTGAVHDFNNYLHAADVALALVERQGPAPELVSSARTALDAMQRLNTALLAYARGAVPAPHPLDVGAVVSATLSLARSVVPSNVDVELEIAPGAQPVMGVRAELEQLVLNLVINASDAMPDGGQLDISVRPCTKRAVLLAIADTGAGIAADHAGNGTSSKRPGRGLGLEIVRSVVGRLGGALRIEPRTTGGGTMVSVMLPTTKG